MEAADESKRQGGQPVLLEEMLEKARRCGAATQPQALNLDAGGYSVNIPETAMEPAAEGPNLIPNGDFEQLEAKGDRPKDWHLFWLLYADAQDRARRECWRRSSSRWPR